MHKSIRLWSVIALLLIGGLGRAYACVPVVSLGTQIVICQGSSITLSAFNPNSTYVWHNGSTAPTYTANSTGLVFVTVTNACGSTTDSVQVTVLPAPNAALGPDTFLCPGQSLTLAVPPQPGVNTAWSTGASGLNTVISSPGAYWIQRSNSCGIDRDTLIVYGLTPPSVVLDPNYWMCGSTPLTLSVPVGPFDAVLWSTGTATASIPVTDTGFYSVTLSNPCGSNTYSTYVGALPDPQDLLPDVAYLCQNGNSLLDPGLPPGQYAWSNGSTGPTLALQQSGSVWLTYSGPCGTFSDTATVVIEPIVAIDLGTDTSLCGPLRIGLSPIPGISYTWSDGSSGDSLELTQSGTYWVSYSSNCNSGADTLEFVLTTPPVVPSLDSLFRCAGAPLSYTVPTQPGTHVSWSDPSLNGNQVQFTQDGNYILTANNACGSAMESFYVVTSTAPLADLGPDSVLCDRIWIKPAQSNYNSIVWSNGSTADSIKVLSGTFWVSVTNGCGTDRDTVVFSTSIPPTPTLPDTLESCQGQNISLSVPYRPFASYLWSSGSATNSTVINTLGMHWVQVWTVCDTLYDTVYVVPVTPYSLPSLQTNYTLCPLDTFVLELDSVIPNNDVAWSNGIQGRRFITAVPGVFILSLSNSCGTVTDTFAVSIGAPPLDVIADTLGICTGQSLVLSALGSGADSVYWFNGTSGFQTTVNSAGYHRVSFHNDCGVLIDSFLVVLEQGLPPLNLGPDVVVCGGSAVLSTGLGGSVQHLWSTGQTSGSLLATASGTYWVQVSNSCQTRYDTIQVDLLQFPTTNIPPVLTFCNGCTLNIDVTQPLSNYLWSDGNSSGVGSFTGAGSYWVQITNLCGTLTDSFDLQFFDAVTVDLGSDTTLCLGDTLVLDAGADNLSQLWSNGSTGRYLSVHQTGAYSVSIQGFCNTASDSISVQFLGDPVFGFGPEVPVCSGGDPVPLTGPPGMETYEWSTGATTPAISTNLSGVYWLRVSNGCYTWVDTLVVVPDSAVPLDFGPDTLLCQGEILELDAGTPVNWSNGGFGSVFQIGSPGTYRCWIVNTCGTYGDTLRVDYVSPLEELVLSGSACRDSSLRVELPAEGDSVVWNDGLNSYNRTLTSPGAYGFTRYNTCGGSPGRYEAVFVDCACGLFVPESFSPNGDGINDYYEIGHSCTLRDFELLIFDRFGSVVHTEIRDDFRWDGTVQGQPLPIGLYHWIANYRYTRNGVDPGFKTQRGSLILIR